MRRSVLLFAAVPTALAALTTACDPSQHSETHAEESSPAIPTPSSSPAWKWHPATANNIDPRKVVTQAEAEKLVGKPMPHADVHSSSPNAKHFPSNLREVIYSNRKTKEFTYDATAYLEVTTKVIDKSLDHDGYRDGGAELNVYGSSGVQTAPLVPAEVGLKDNSSAQVYLVVHGLVDSKHYYPNPTQHDLNNPYGVFIWGNQLLGNGKTRPVRLSIMSEGNPSNRKDLLALASKAVARMNLK